MRTHRNLHSLRRSDVKPWVLKDGEHKRGADAVVLHGVTMRHPADQVAARRCRGELPPYVNPKTGVARKAERAVFAWLNAESCTEQATTPQRGSAPTAQHGWSDNDPPRNRRLLRTGLISRLAGRLDLWK